MDSSEFDYSDYGKIAPKGDEPPTERGCFFYGCVIAAVLSVLLLIAIGVVTFLLYRWVGTVVDQYTSIAPHVLPTSDLSADRRVALRKRFDEFRAAVKENRPASPLILDADEINALIEENPDWKGRIYIALDGDRVKGQVSLPLSEIPAFGLTQGRYLNGSADFHFALEDGRPSLTIRSLEVNGKSPPQAFLKGILNRNFLNDAQYDEETERGFRRLERIEVRDGKLIIRPREQPKEPAGAATLPDDVMAPAESRPAVPIESGGPF